MAVFDGLTGLDFAYKGFQYPLPPAWKRAIRLEDQINWLLQALMAVNDSGINDEELHKAISELDNDLQGQINDLHSGWESGDSRLQEQIKNITAGLFLVHNPITGSYDYHQVAFRQLFDSCRPFAATYADIDYLGIGEATAHGTAQTDQYLSYNDLDGLIYGSFANRAGAMTEGATLYPAPAPDATGRMVTAEFATADEICYFSLDFYGRFVLKNACEKAKKDTSLIAMFNDALNCAITPAAAMQNVEPGYDYSPTIFTTYGEMDVNGVLGYKENI